MILINASEFGIMPGQEIAEKLIELFSCIKTVEGEKILSFSKGTLYR